MWYVCDCGDRWSAPPERSNIQKRGICKKCRPLLRQVHAQERNDIQHKLKTIRLDRKKPA